ncbi:MAG: OmpA family protein [Proteobacteria bacterium]|nr:OmpA family protein [Pseudomonadota bacterium]
MRAPAIPSGLLVGSLIGSLITGCHAAHPKPTALRLQRVILYQNGIGYFERRGQVGGDTIHFELSRHEVDDVLKTLTVIDATGGGVATVDIPEIKDKDRVVHVGVKLSQGRAHDVQVNYAIPTPTWKAAYRVVLDDQAPSAPPTGLLQGWAMINNVSQEDWDHVQLTLATGAPMSYALDLHSPQYALRPDATGKLVAPTVLGPIENEHASAAQAEDPDADKDGIPVASDLCPTQPEDKDGFEDEDGCPDPDNDKDRIADVDDRCPNEPETYNGFDDDDGCPDRGRVIVSDSSLEILDMIYFKRGEAAIGPSSYPIADAVAATLVGNPSVMKVELQGHADATEPDAWGLSTRRAAAVRGYLLKHGVAPERLAITSFGASQPLDKAATDMARAKNRRVMFHIVQRADDDAGGRAAPDKPTSRPIDVRAAAVDTSSKPVEVAGAVRYELGEPVSIRHGGSTMVSILSKAITAEDVLLFRPDANAPGSGLSPFRAVRLVNSSGYTLQPGPIAIFARGTFVGDSLIDTLDLDATAWVPYALDSSTTVTSGEAVDERGVRIVSILKGVATVENAMTLTTTYAIATGRQPPHRIFVRHRKTAGYAAKDLPPGSIDQGDAYLLSVPVTGGKASELVVEERQPRTRSFRLADVHGPDLATYLAGSGLAAGVGDKITAVLALRKEATALADEVRAAQDKLTEIAQRAYEIRENIQALATVRDAAALRKQLVASLAQTVTESDALTKLVAARMEAAATANARLDAAIRDLLVEEKGK